MTTGVTLSSTRRSLRTVALLGALLTLSALAAPLEAQETIYVLQELPSEIHGFTFDASGLSVLDINPDPLAESLPYSPQSRRFAATDEWFLLGNAQTNSSTNITDPNGVSLPPSSTTVAASGSFVPSSDGNYAFALEALNSTPARMGVVDIDPGSATFLEEVATLDLSGSNQGVHARGVLSTDGTTLYAIVWGFGAGQPIEILAIDVLDPANLDASDILSTTSVPIPASSGVNWDPGVLAASLATVAGSEYLFVSRGVLLHALEITAPGTLALRMTQTSNHPTFGTLRNIRDFVVFDDAGTPRSIVYSDSCDFDHVDFVCLATGEEELLVIDLTLPLPLEDIGGARITNTHRLLSPDGEAGTAPPGGEYVVEWGNHGVAAASLDGQTLFVLSNNPSPGAQAQGRLRAFDITSVVTGPVDSASSVGGSEYFSLLAFDLMVRNEVLPASSPPVLVDAALDASEGGGVTLENDADRAVDILGSNLSNVTHVALGTSWVTVDALTSTTADVTVPAFVPTGRPQLVAVNDARGVTAFDGLVVVPPGDFLPNAVAYAGNDSGSISVVSASTGSEVAPSFPTVFGATGLAVSPDGRYLVVDGFSGNEIAVHCIVLDAETSSAIDPGNPLGYADYQWSGCSDWNDLMYSHRTSGVVGALATTKPDRSRMYINTIFPTVDIVDMTASPPVAVGSIQVTDFISRGFSIRGIAATDSHLYLGNTGSNWALGQLDAYIVVVDITDDVVDPATEIFVVDIPALSSIGAFGRGDGLAVHPDGTRLYYAMSGSPHIWILDIGADPTNPAAIQGPAVPNYPGGGEVFNLLVAPDGEFLYVSRRSGDTHVYDLSDKDAPVLLNTVATGPFSNAMGVSPNGDFVYVPVLTRNAVVVLDGRDGSPTQHQVLTVIGSDGGTSVVTVTPGIETEAGTNVAVEPIEGSSITFDEVTTSGSTTVTATNTSETPISADFEIAGVGVFYDVETTATFEGEVTICFDYDDTGMTSNAEKNLKLLHEEEIDGTKCDPPGSVPCWDDVTAPGSPDINANRICGTVTSFSLFVAAVQKTVRPRIDIKPDDPDNEINLTSNGVVNVAIFGSAGFDVTTIDPNSLALAGGSIRQKTKGAAVTYSDLDGDGFLDVKAQFEISALQLTQGTTEAEVTGELSDEQSMAGTDEVSVVQ